LNGNLLRDESDFVFYIAELFGWSVPSRASS
jgi:hypothetical protein